MPCLSDLVIFDSDGVLVDTEAVDDEIIATLLAEVGIQVTPLQISRMTRGMHAADIWPLFEREFGREVPVVLRERWEMEALAAFAARLEAIPGVIEVLIALTKTEVPMCVASSGSHKKLAVTLGTTGLELFFDGNIFSATQVAHSKPRLTSSSSPPRA